MNLEEKTLKKNILYTGRVIRLRNDEVLLPNGRTANREVVDHPGGVCVAALTNQNELLMVRQFRYPYEQVVTEIPAGKLEWGEDPLECARRELQEETGAVAQRYRFLGDLYPSPGYCGEIIRIFFAEELSFGVPSPDQDEFLDVLRVPLQEAVEMVMANRLPDAKTQTAILKTAVLRGVWPMQMDDAQHKQE